MLELNRLKIITIDYKGGISPGVIDAVPESVIIVNSKRYKDIFKRNWDNIDYIIFLGHDFLFFLYDKKKKIKYWQKLNAKKIIWCFERINCIVEEWRKRSLKCFNNVKLFADYIFVADEEDYRTFDNVHFLPQWSSPRFKNEMRFEDKIDKILFTGQFGTVAYEKRTALLSRIKNDPEIGCHLHIANSSRIFSWDEYIYNFIKHKYILNPIGNLVSFNTRTYETIVAGNILFQQIDDRFQIYRNLLSEGKEVIYFNTYKDFKKKFVEILNNPEKSSQIHANTRRVAYKHIVFPRLKWIFRCIKNN